MGWKQFVRSARAAARRSERAAMRRHRELQREHERQQKASKRQRAADEVARFESYLALLVSVHAECGEPWDWPQIAATPGPIAPAPPGAAGQEALARAALEGYRPGFFDRLFGGDKKARAALEEAVRAGAAADRQAREAALADYGQQLERWQATRQLADGVRRLDLEACRIALDHAGAFDELQAFETRVVLASIGPAGATLRCQIEDAELVPKEELKLTAGGKVSTKDMAAGRYWALYQDHACSCAIRVARETFAVLPVAGAAVNVVVPHLDPGSGHVGPTTVLAVHLTREGLAALKLDAIDPSAALERFDHRSGFRRTGLQAIEPMSAAGDAAEPAGDALELAGGSSVSGERAAAPGDEGELAGEALAGEALAGEEGSSAHEFLRWLTNHLAGKASAGFKIKTLVNQLGHFRAERRLSLKAVHDLAAVLAGAGFELDPDPRDATRSPGIDARARVVRAQDAEARREEARREADRGAALLGFLWGAGFRRLYLTPSPGRPQPDAASVESVPDLLEAVQQDPARHLEALEHLVASGALERWLLEAQQDARLSGLASELRRDAEAGKGERWYQAATRAG